MQLWIRIRAGSLMRLTQTLNLFAAIAIAAPVAPLEAQQPVAAPPRTGKGEITGVVVDSLNMRYLPGAEVIISGTTETRVTDSVGRFTIDSLPPGTYQVGVFHPLLDTLGLSLATRPFRVGPDSTSSVVFSVPSAATIIHDACPARSGALGTSAVIGRVVDPETLVPIAGVEASLSWTEFAVSKETGLQRIPHLLRDTTTATGTFHICGLPNSLQATLQARMGTAVTSEIPVALGDADPELLARTLLLSRADSGAKSGTASVSGTVILEGGAPGAGSRVELVGTDVVALTNDKGEFTMTNLPSGSRALLARHLGYGAETAPVDLSSRAPQSVTITLPKYVAIMDPVLVTARRKAGLDRVGFGQRSRSGAGYFLGPDRLKNMNPVYVSDILRRVPGIRVTYSPRGDIISSSRGVTSFSGSGCVQYVLDDMQWRSMEPGDINSFINAHEIVGVEVYQPGFAPPQFVQGPGGCMVIVLWTRFKVGDLTDR
jgi:hypothetical protein